MIFSIRFYGRGSDARVKKYSIFKAHEKLKNMMHKIKGRLQVTVRLEGHFTFRSPDCEGNRNA